MAKIELTHLIDNTKSVRSLSALSALNEEVQRLAHRLK